MKRLLIYVTYDRQNIIDDYVGYFLSCMQLVADYIAVVCNMPKVEKGLCNLSEYADEIFYRENVGLDAGGFKDMLCTFLGWDKVKQYDELILVNDSFYGPFDDIRRIFTEMESRNLDFWGVMKRGPGEYGLTGNDPEHILSFFYVFQAPLLHKKEFRDYWESMPYYKDYMTVVKKYERQLTKHFADLGYAYDTYSDTEPNESSKRRNQFFQCDYLSYEMIAKRNFPFLKRKQLAYNTLHNQTQENLALSIDYIDRHTDYDVNLIWKNLIRTQHHTELQRSMGLQYILEDSGQEVQLRVVICVCVKWKNAIDAVCEYLERIRNICDIRIFSEDAYAMERYREKGYNVILSDKSDIEILQMATALQYSYICLIHDTDLSSDQVPSCTGKSYFFNIWENLIKNAGYIANLIQLFETKRYLGVLMHPIPIFSMWIGQLNYEWRGNYARVEQYIKELHLSAVISPEVPPIHVTNNFWIRASVIQKFSEKFGSFENHDNDFAAICNYLWDYIVQDGGKLTGIVESSFYASMNEVNYHYYLKTIMEWFADRYGYHKKLYEYKEIFRVHTAVEKCKGRHEKWYVYGTGEIAERCFEWIRDTFAFIVSDGQLKMPEFHGKPVIYLSELPEGDESGIILCLSEENQRNVLEMLEKKKINNYYMVN